MWRSSRSNPSPATAWWFRGAITRGGRARAVHPLLPPASARDVLARLHSAPPSTPALTPAHSHPRGGPSRASTGEREEGPGEVSKRVQESPVGLSGWTTFSSEPAVSLNLSVWGPALSLSRRDRRSGTLGFRGVEAPTSPPIGFVEGSGPWPPRTDGGGTLDDSVSCV